MDVIEAGFPAASPGDFEAVSRIAKESQGVAVAALARCRDGDPQRAVEAIRVSERPHLHVFIATRDIHLKHKLKITREQALAEAVRWVRYGREQLGRDAEMEFSAEDASRTDLDFLLAVYEAVVEAGATTVNIPDTVGYAIPAEFGSLVGRRRRPRRRRGRRERSTATTTWASRRRTRSPRSRPARARWRSRSTASASAPVTRPWRRSSWRSGRGPRSSPRSCSHVQTEQITTASRLVSLLTGFSIQPNKAVVGANAFAHESGIHQDGVIKNPLTYEIMTPQSVGLSGSQLTIGKLSGRKGLQKKLRDLGYHLEGPALDLAYREAIALADRKKEVTDADLIAIVEQHVAARRRRP